jgi:hypothetical protein
VWPFSLCALVLKRVLWMHYVIDFVLYVQLFVEFPLRPVGKPFHDGWSLKKIK